MEYFEDGRFELYNLRNDLGEKIDLAKSLPDRRDNLAAKLRALRKSVYAQMPIHNPDFKR